MIYIYNCIHKLVVLFNNNILKMKLRLCYNAKVRHEENEICHGFAAQVFERSKVHIQYDPSTAVENENGAMLVKPEAVLLNASEVQSLRTALEKIAQKHPEELQEIREVMRETGLRDRFDDWN